MQRLISLNGATWCNRENDLRKSIFSLGTSRKRHHMNHVLQVNSAAFLELSEAPSSSVRCLPRAARARPGMEPKPQMDATGTIFRVIKVEHREDMAEIRSQVVIC